MGKLWEIIGQLCQNIGDILESHRKIWEHHRGHVGKMWENERKNIGFFEKIWENQWWKSMEPMWKASKMGGMEKLEGFQPYLISSNLLQSSMWFQCSSSEKKQKEPSNHRLIEMVHSHSFPSWNLLKWPATIPATTLIKECLSPTIHIYLHYQSKKCFCFSKSRWMSTFQAFQGSRTEVWLSLLLIFLLLLAAGVLAISKSLQCAEAQKSARYALKSSRAAEVEVA